MRKIKRSCLLLKQRMINLWRPCKQLITTETISTTSWKKLKPRRCQWRKKSRISKTNTTKSKVFLELGVESKKKSNPTSSLTELISFQFWLKREKINTSTLPSWPELSWPFSAKMLALTTKKWTLSSSRMCPNFKWKWTFKFQTRWLMKYCLPRRLFWMTSEKNTPKKVVQRNSRKSGSTNRCSTGLPSSWKSSRLPRSQTLLKFKLMPTPKNFLMSKMSLHISISY